MRYTFFLFSLFLLVATESNATLRVFMRHGEQAMEARLENLSAAEQKIEMMRLPNNQEDPLTETSINSLPEVAKEWVELKEKEGATFTIRSSKNRRALQVAEALAEALDAPLELDPTLDCLNYPSEEEVGRAALLAQLPNGSLPWKREVVNQILGDGTYEEVVTTMKRQLEQPEESDVIISVTHTQQVNAIQELIGEEPTRLPNFGYVKVEENQKSSTTKNRAS